MKPTALFTLTLAVLMLASLGCSSTKPPREAVSEPQIEDAYPQVTIEGKLKIAKHRPIVVPAEGRTPMHVTVPVRLRSNDRAEVQYRFAFLDDRGAPTGPPMDWRWKVLPPRTVVYLEGGALDHKAVDWRLEIRPNLESD